MKKSLFQTQFTLDDVPHWGCPTCGKGILQASKDLFVTKESHDSREYHRNSHNPEPEFHRSVYTCFLTCSSSTCQEVVVNTGEFIGDVVVIDEEWDDFSCEFIEVKDWADCYRPQYFQPNLKIISIPEKCPEAVKKSLNESFKLFFASPSAAANGVRIALEKLLDELKIDRYYSNNKNNKEIRLTLDKRIGNLPEEYSRIQEMMNAVKWLGNAGSHSSDEIKTNDVMDAYELIEHILEEIYEEPKVERIKAMAKQINKNKGPISIKFS